MNGTILSDPELSAVVSANAGTGKTKVLTDRVLRLMLEGVQPSKILCLTYTKAAAAEMSTRISRELEKWLSAEEDDLKNIISSLTGKPADENILRRARKLFAKVIDSSPALRIQTIHSFAESLLKRFPIESGLPPYFKVIDETTSRALAYEAKIKLLGSDGQDEATAAAIARLSSTSSEFEFDEIIEEITIGHARFRRYLENFSSPALAVEYLFEKFSVEEGAVAKARAMREIPVQEMRLLASALVQSPNKTDIERGEKLAAILAGDLGAESFYEYAILFLTAEHEPRKKLVSKPLYSLLYDAERIILAEQARLEKSVGEVLSAETLERTGNIILAAAAFLKIYYRLKSARAYLDYDDLISAAKDLLSTSASSQWVLYKLDGGLEHILVDEAQDTNPVQWDIITRLMDEFFSGGGGGSGSTRTVFVVGDEKQSIYSFQGADPAAYHRFSKELALKCEASGRKWAELPLDKSYRSVSAVLKIVDAVFSEPELRRSVSFSAAVIEHRVHRKGEGGAVEIWRIEPGDDGEDSAIADKIASSISEWLSSSRILASKGRAVQPGDIMILLRKRGGLAGRIIKKLKNKGISVAGADRLVITNHIAVMDLLALAKFLLLPDDCLSLAASLKSPLFGVSEEELFELCRDRGGKTLWQSLEERRSVSPAISRAHAVLAELLRIVDFTPPYELFSTILENMEGRKNILSRLGPEALDPVEELLSLALEFESGHVESLQSFLHWVHSGQTEIKRDMEHSGNEVRVMTVHGSKGLQAPIVFLPDAGNKGGKKEKLIWDESGAPLANGKGGGKLAEAIESRKEREHHEYMRLLYVALTRAADELYIIGTPKAHEQSWYSACLPPMTALSGETLRHACNQEKPLPRLPEKQALPTIPPLPHFFKTKTRAESPENDAPKLPDAETEASLRGVLIHKILEIAPQLTQSRRRAAIEKLAGGDREISHKTLALLENPRFSHFFSPHSVAEAEVAAEIDGEITLRRIDRLLVTDDSVFILDYKTDRSVPSSPASIPASYRKQLESYASLARSIYPEKKIHTAILWFETMEIMEIDTQVLQPI